jgi:hypothetical protein
MIYLSTLRVLLPKNVGIIGEGAFGRCTDLKSISIPKGVTSIGRYTFYECTNLTSVNFEGMIASANFSSSQSLPHYPATCEPSTLPHEVA